MVGLCSLSWFTAVAWEGGCDPETCSYLRPYPHTTQRPPPPRPPRAPFNNSAPLGHSATPPPPGKNNIKEGDPHGSRAPVVAQGAPKISAAYSMCAILSGARRGHSWRPPPGSEPLVG